MCWDDPLASVVVRTCPGRGGWLCEALRSIDAQLDVTAGTLIRE